MIINANGPPTGFDVELLDLLNKKLGTNIELRLGRWTDMAAQAQAREIDGLTLSAPLEKRKTHFLFSNVYFTTYKCIFTRTVEDFGINGLQTLAGRRVAIQQANGFSRNLLNDIPRVEIVEAPGRRTMMELLLKGQLDAAFEDSLMYYDIVTNKIAGIKMQTVIADHPLSLVYSIRRDWPELVVIINKGLAAMTEDERVQILKKYAMEMLRVESQNILKLTDRETAWLAQNRTIRVRVDHLPPYMIKGKYGPQGIAIEYPNMVANKNGFPFQFIDETSPYGKALASPADPNGPDLIHCFSQSQGLESHLVYTREYQSSPVVIFTRDEPPVVSGIEDLRGRTVAMTRETNDTYQLAEKYPGLQPLLFDSDDQALLAVAAGQAGAYIGDLSLASFLVIEHGLKNIKIAAPTPLPDRRLSFGIRKDWPELAGIIDKTLDALPEVEKANICNKYLSMRYEYDIHTRYIIKWALVIGGSAAGLLLFVIVWNRGLARKVDERTMQLNTTNQSLRTEIQDRRNAEHELRKSRDYLKNLTDSLPDVVYSVSMPERKIIWANNTVKMLGYEPEECIGKTTDFLYANREDYLAYGEELARAIAVGNNILHSELLLRKKSGELVPVEVTVSLFRVDGELVNVAGVVRDISERKQKESRLERYQQLLKALAVQLTIAEEHERRRIAADLHDHIGQLLALTNMQVASVSKLLSEPALTAILDEISETLAQAVQQIRSLIYDLSPPQLNEIGLAAAIREWLEGQVSKRYGLQTEFIESGVEVPVDEELRTILFRSVRYLVTNVIKHAQATRVRISLNRLNDHLEIMVSDNGFGFDTYAKSKSVTAEGGFGLFSIRERMADLGGTVEISSQPGQGTRAILSVPLEKGPKVLS